MRAISSMVRQLVRTGVDRRGIIGGISGLRLENYVSVFVFQRNFWNWWMTGDGIGDVNNWNTVYQQVNCPTRLYGISSYYGESDVEFRKHDSGGQR
jgi:hypothetical protein